MKKGFAPARMKHFRRTGKCWQPILSARMISKGAATRDMNKSELQVGFKGVSTFELFTRYSLLKLSSVPGVLTAVRGTTSMALDRNQKSSGFLSQIFINILKKTIYPLYTAGEHFNGCKNVKRSFTGTGVSLMIDHSVEGVASDSARKEARNQKIKLISSVCESKVGDFVAIKVTAVFSMDALIAMSEVITERKDWREAVWTPNETSKSCLEDMLSKDVSRLWKEGMDSMNEICTHAHKNGVKVLVDAEESNMQPAIEYLARCLMSTYNREDPIVYNTFQMYLRDGIIRLERDLSDAEKNDYIMAAKIVRGAYMTGEAERAKTENTESAINNSKEETDAQYNRALEVLMKRIALNQKNGNERLGPAFMAATHNRDSISNAIELMNNLGIPPRHPGVRFAQILGLCDNIPRFLGRAGYNAHVLVLYGKFGELFPFLLRRLDESCDSFGAIVNTKLLYHSSFERLDYNFSVPTN